MTRSAREKIFGILALLCALFFLFRGLWVRHKVFQERDAVVYYQVGDLGLIIDATFSGVERHDDRLISTYDRAQGAGRRACPT